MRFTLTAPGCGMADSLQMDMEAKILSIPGVKECEVSVVFDPPWDRALTLTLLSSIWGMS